MNKTKIVKTPRLASRFLVHLRCLVILTALLMSSAVVFAQRTDPPTPRKAPSPSEIAQSGQLDGSSYKNKLLQFSLAVPENWSFASEEMNRTVLTEGNSKIKANETKERQEAFDRSMANSIVLFMVSKYPLGNPAHTGNLASGFERTTSTAAAYIDFNKNLLMGKLPNAKLNRDTRVIRVGGKEFSTFDIEGDFNGVLVKQSYYATARNDGILFFVITWIKEDDTRKSLENVLQSIKFDS